MSYCVYEHYYNNKIIYVGSGTIKRAHRKSFRNEKYEKMCNGDKDKVEVKIVALFNNREDAFEYEEGLTRWYFEEKIDISNLQFGKRAFKDLNAFYGKNHSLETKNKIGLKNKKWQLENKEKFREIMKETFTDEWKKKVSLSKKGKKLSKEHKEKISKSITGDKNGMYGKTHTENSMKNMVKNRKDFAKIKVINLKTNEEFIFDSANQAAKHFSLKPYMITRKTNNGNVYYVDNLKIWRLN